MHIAAITFIRTIVLDQTCIITVLIYSILSGKQRLSLTLIWPHYKTETTLRWSNTCRTCHYSVIMLNKYILVIAVVVNLGRRNPAIIKAFIKRQPQASHTTCYAVRQIWTATILDD
jgi:hypothetical protein